MKKSPVSYFQFPEKKAGITFSLLFIFLITNSSIAQDMDIVNYLKLIERGEKDEVEKILPGLKEEYPNSPSVMFLDGVLTENGQDAVVIYSKIVNSYPASKYADAALYRIYSYYYALGLYEAAKKHLNKLEKEYPDSPYLKIADKNIPSEDEVVPGGKREIETPEIISEFTIQAGAFTKLENAQGLKKDFDDSGFKSNLKDKTIGGTLFHIVYVGEFETENEAKNFLQVINKEFKLDGRVVKMENGKW
jgi:tetratricopeptide (TPR) repeat protein